MVIAIRAELYQALPEQSDKIFGIIEENAQWLLAKGIIQWPLDWLADERDAIYQSVLDGNYYCSKIDQDIAAVVELKTGPEVLWDNDLSDALYLHKLAICRQYSGCNMGLEILDQVKMRAMEQNITSIRLDCVAHNTKLRNYYESYGFKLINKKSNGVIDVALYELRL